jgi:hypothetical protein
MIIDFPQNRQIVTYILSVLLLLAALSPARLAASALTLAWDPEVASTAVSVSLQHIQVERGFGG